MTSIDGVQNTKEEEKVEVQLDLDSGKSKFTTPLWPPRPQHQPQGFPPLHDLGRHNQQIDRARKQELSKSRLHGSLEYSNQ